MLSVCLDTRLSRIGEHALKEVSVKSDNPETVESIPSCNTEYNLSSNHGRMAAGPISTSVADQKAERDEE